MLYAPRNEKASGRVDAMPFSSWRGVVGIINPTMRPGVTEETIRLLPEGIGVIPLFLDFRRGGRDEFEKAIPNYERNVAILAEQGCDPLPFAAPPDIPGDRAAALQTAFTAMCRDPAFLEEAEKLGFDVSPIDAAEVQQLLARSAATPRDVIERYNALGDPQKK
jgi:hypothetical protein